MMSKKLILCLWMTFSFAVAMTAANRKFVLVIDAGHGGHDAGALGYVSKEKDLTLRYALAFGAAVEKNCPDVKVIYTRKTDVFVELWRRAEIANQAKADLFVSVHINSVGKGRIARGYQTYTLGKGESGTAIDKNLDVAKRENSVILLEPNYQQIYQGYDPNSPESDILFEFIQDNNMERTVELSKYMQRYVCRATGRQDMGAHQKNLAVLRLKLGVEGSAMFSPRFTNTIEMHDGEGREMLFNYRSRAVSWGAAAWVQAELLRVIIGVGYSASSLELSKHFSATTRTTYDDYPQGIFARVGVYF